MTTSNDRRSPAAWLARILTDQENVASAKVITGNRIAVARTDEGTVEIAVVAVPCLTLEGLAAADIDMSWPDVIVNIPRDAVVMGEVLDLGQANGIPVLGVGALKGALLSNDLSHYVDRERLYVERILNQDPAVIAVTRLDNARYRLTRDGLPTVTVLVINEYDLTAERVRWAIETFEGFDAMWNSNPNARLSSAAEEAAHSAGIRLFVARDIRRALGQLWT